MDARSFSNPTSGWAADGAIADAAAPGTGAISREHGLALLARLADDDAFRARYEVDPRACLRELGVPAATLEGLRVICFWPQALAPKAAFRALLDHAEGEAFAHSLEFRIPRIG